MPKYNTANLRAEDIARGLKKFKKTGPSKFVACCPAHNDNDPSLDIRETSEGKVLVHCFGGCPQEEVISALKKLGLWHQGYNGLSKLKAQNAEYEHNKFIVEIAKHDELTGVSKNWTDEDKKTIALAKFKLLRLELEGMGYDN